MINFGEVPLGSVLPIPFATYAAATGASVTLTGLATTDIEVYKGTTVTQRSSDAGYALIDTDGIDIDGITGIHGFSIDTGDNTDAGFFVAGSFYYVVVSAVTVDSQTVNFIAATFSLSAQRSVAGVPEVDVTHFNGTAGTFSGGRPEVNTTHAAGTAWGSGAITAASIASDAITAAKIAAGAIDAATFAADVDAEIAGMVWNAATASFGGAGTYGQALEDVLDDTGTAGVVVAAGSKTGYSLTPTTGLGNQTADITGSLSGSVGSVTGNVGGNVSGSVGSVVGAVGSVTGLTASDVAAIKAKTDSLTFTQAGHVDANIQRINDVAIVGDGSGTPFGV